MTVFSHAVFLGTNTYCDSCKFLLHKHTITGAILFFFSYNTKRHQKGKTQNQKKKKIQSSDIMMKSSAGYRCCLVSDKTTEYQNRGKHNLTAGMCAPG